MRVEDAHPRSPALLEKKGQFGASSAAMSFRRTLFPLLSLVWISSAVACSDEAKNPVVRTDSGVDPADSGRDAGHDGGRGDTGLDSGFVIDAGRDAYVPPLDPCNPTCGESEYCGETGQGNGADEDCDGRVDESCECMGTSTTQSCYPGPPERRNVGACADGQQTCDEFNQWSSCIGSVTPTDEVCDGIDNDCDGSRDEGLTDCTNAVACPSSETTFPLRTYPLDGTAIFAGEIASWAWTVECPPSVPADLCPAATDPTQRTTDIYFAASGSYRVTAEFTTAAKETYNCGWTVYVRGDGLRVELNWDTMPRAEGGTDLDLHLHRWTRNGVDTDWNNGDDCYYGNCKPSGAISWRNHYPTDLSYCENAPHGGGARWQGEGECRNPRLDIDMNGDSSCDPAVTDPASNSYCAPENINIDEPLFGVPYRVMVNYFSSHGSTGATHPTLNIYCGGELKASFGADPIVELRDRGSSGLGNDNWTVADVVFYDGMCGVNCTVYPVELIERGSTSFGPAWSCMHDPGTASCE